MRATRIGKWLAAFAILAFCIIIGAVSTAAQPSSPTPTAVSQNAATPQASATATLSAAEQQTLLKQAVQINGAQYPKVVATVDGHPISGQNLAQQVFVIQNNPQDAMYRNDAVNVALNWLIQDQVLLDHASDYGVNISDDDVKSYIQQVKAQAATDPSSQALTNALAKQLGVDPSKYYDQPQVIQQYKDGLTLTSVQRIVLSKVPANQRTGDWETQAIANFVNGLKPKVQILISH